MFSVHIVVGLEALLFPTARITTLQIQKNYNVFGSANLPQFLAK